MQTITWRTSTWSDQADCVQVGVSWTVQADA